MKTFLIAIFCCVSELAWAGPLGVGDPATARALQANAAGGGASYTATKFDGATYLANASGVSTLQDSTTVTVSFWLKMLGSDGVKNNIVVIAAADGSASGLRIMRESNDYLYFQLFNTSGTQILDASSYPATFTASDGWVHWFLSADMSGTPTIKIFKNGTLTANVNSSSAGTIDLERSNAYIGWNDNVFGNFAISELWMDDSYNASPTNWRNGTHPADLGSDGSTPTGSQPAVYLKNSSATFQNNLGSGDSFTIDAGVLLNYTTDLP